MGHSHIRFMLAGSGIARRVKLPFTMGGYEEGVSGSTRIHPLRAVARTGPPRQTAIGRPVFLRLRTSFQPVR